MTKTTKSASAKSAAKTSRTKSPDNASQKIRPIQIDLPHQLTEQFRELRLPSFRDHFQEAATQAATENLSHLEFLSALATLECEACRDGRIRRMMTRSRLLYGKTWGTLKFDRLPLNVTRQLETLRDGSFLNRRENMLIFGRPGSGKSHVLCALAEQLIQHGEQHLFTTCNLLVQQFSKWDQIFKDTMTTAAAIDRLVHHSGIIELNVPSFRVETAQNSKSKGQSPATKPPVPNP